MAQSTIKAGLESRYAKGSFLRTVSITITGSLTNVDNVKNLLLPYIRGINIGTTILDAETSGGGHATFIISNSGGYSDALQLSYYLSGKLRVFHYDNGNWTVKEFAGTTV